MCIIDFYWSTEPLLVNLGDNFILGGPEENKDLSQVRILTEKWLLDYNANNPHSSLNGLSPIEFKNDVNSGKLTVNISTEEFPTINIEHHDE